MIARFLPLLAFVAACSGELPTAPTPPPVALALRVDVNAHSIDAMNVRRATAIGAHSIRTTLYWGPTQSDQQLIAFAVTVAAARQLGVDVVIVVHDEPIENKALPFTERVNAFGAYMERAAAAMPGCSWELFNEIDANGFDDLFASSYDVSDSAQLAIGARYGAMLARVVPRIRAADPTSRVASAGISVNVSAFLSGMHSATDVRLDAITVHAYGFPNSAQFVDSYRRAVRVYPSTAIWVTEFGLDDSEVPGQHSAEQYDTLQRDDVARTIAANPGYARAFIYVLYTGQDHDYAIYRADGTPRPAADWIAKNNAQNLF